MSSQTDRCLINLCIIPKHLVLTETTQDSSVEMEMRVYAVRAMRLRIENNRCYNISMLGALGLPPHHRFTICSSLSCFVSWEDDLQGLHDLCSVILWLSPGMAKEKYVLLLRTMGGRQMGIYSLPRYVFLQGLWYHTMATATARRLSPTVSALRSLVAMLTSLASSGLRCVPEPCSHL